MQIKFEMIYLIIGVICSSFAQILLKKSVLRYGIVKAEDEEADNDSRVMRLVNQYKNPYVLTGYLLILISMLIPLYAFRFVDLKYGAVIEALGYVFIMILSALFLHEKITARKLAGNALIVAGVIIFASSFLGV